MILVHLDKMCFDRDRHKVMYLETMTTCQTYKMWDYLARERLKRTEDIAGKGKVETSSCCGKKG